MANMSYCRFENTYRDLLDCYHNMNNDKSDDEQAYMRRLVDVCKDIVDEYELMKMSEDDNDDEPEYDGAGFSEEDRIVNEQYRVIDADMEVQDSDVFGNNKI